MTALSQKMAFGFIESSVSSHDNESGRAEGGFGIREHFAVKGSARTGKNSCVGPHHITDRVNDR
jgi:hypothetical protein